MSHKILRSFIVKVSVLGYFPLVLKYNIHCTVYTIHCTLHNGTV